MVRMLTLLLGIVALAGSAHAQAYCGLRDPNRQINRLFPEATSFRSVVRTIDKEARSAVSERLPFTLHFNELGRHTLYVVQRDDETIGLVHVRSEAGRWGLVEIAWALDLDMRVVDFEFQRCRDRSKKVLSDDPFRSALIGRDFRSLRSLVDRDGDRLVDGALSVDEKAKDLAAVVVRNGLKTIAATECAWRSDVWALRAKRFARDVAPAARSLRALDDLYGEDVVAMLEDRVGAEGTGIVREKSLAWELVCERGTTVKHVFVTRWEHDDLAADILWFVSPEGVLTSIEPQGRWPREEVMEAFGALVGKDADALCDCGGPVELAAYEVLLTVAEKRTIRAR